MRSKQVARLLANGDEYLNREKSCLQFWLSTKSIVARMKQSVIREAHAQHGTLLIGARFAGAPGLRASHSIQATSDTEIL